MYQRINITLPKDTVKLLERVAPSGDRSRLIDDAVRLYITHVGKASLRKRLKTGALKSAARDAEIASEWFELEDTYAE